MSRLLLTVSGHLATLVHVRSIIQAEEQDRIRLAANIGKYRLELPLFASLVEILQRTIMSGVTSHRSAWLHFGGKSFLVHFGRWIRNIKRCCSMRLRTRVDDKLMLLRCQSIADVQRKLVK